MWFLCLREIRLLLLRFQMELFFQNSLTKLFRGTHSKTWGIKTLSKVVYIPGYFNVVNRKTALLILVLPSIVVVPHACTNLPSPKSHPLLTPKRNKDSADPLWLSQKCRPARKLSDLGKNLIRKTIPPSGTTTPRSVPVLTSCLYSHPLTNSQTHRNASGKPVHKLYLGSNFLEDVL